MTVKEKSMEGRKILSGIKVIDLASFVAGPASAGLLGDFGADVIKVEPPEGGDFFRRVYRTPGMPPCDHNFAWMFTGRNKRSLALNIKQPEAHAALMRLVKEADVVVVNYPPQVRERLKIRYEDLAPLNERLIYASISGYGDKGAEINNPGFDLTAWWARTGMMDTVRGKGAPPAMCMPAMGDHPTALGLFGGIMLALFDRERTGKGTEVTTSLLANGLWVNGILAQAILCGSGEVSVPGPANPLTALNNLYLCKDERWFVLAIQNEEKCWPVMTSLLKRPDLTEDQRYIDTKSRWKNAAVLSGIFADIFKTEDMRHWIKLFAGTPILISPVNKLEDIRDDRQMRDAEVIVPYTTPDGSQMETIVSPMWVRGAEKRAPGHAPELGQHTDEILREAGYSDAEVQTMRKTGAVA